MERDGTVTDHAYAELLHQYEILGGYTLDQRVDSALTGLGFTRDEWAKPPSALSGGEQTRASLARLVIADPDLLLLDEPTNHLDLDALEWLEEHLRRRSGSLLVASHDRAFLDATVDRVWELRDRRLTAFRGDYSAYHRQRVERDARAVKDVDTQAEQIAREKELIQRYRSHRKFSKHARARGAARAARGGAARGPQGRAGSWRSRRPRWSAAPARRAAARSSCASRISRSATCRGAARRRRTARSRPRPRSSLGRRSWPPSAASGSASSGRTARARRRCSGRSPATCHRSTASITFGNAVQIGYLAQLRSAAIAGRDRARRAAGGGARHGRARRAAYLARFLFRGDDAFKEVRLLSGGERSRLELALLGIQPSNLLLLDEPTNHLDIPAREAIEAFMAGSPATLLVVSHDRRLLETVCDKLWVVGEGSRGGVRWRLPRVAGRGRGWLDGGDGAPAEAAGARPPPCRSRAPRSLRRPA